MKVLLAPGGVITMEFPHLMRLIDENQFDTIYHEHFSYFSLLDRARACSRRTGCALFDVEELPTHGGSLRIFGCHADDARQAATERAPELLRARATPRATTTLETYARVRRARARGQARAPRRS